MEHAHAINTLTRDRMFDELRSLVKTKTFKNPFVLLETLTAHEYSAAWCMLLHKMCAKQSVPPGVAELLEKFFMEFDVQQVRGVCADLLVSLAHLYTAWCRTSKCPSRGIPYLLHAIKILRPSPDHLTPLHCDYVCLCLLQRKYALARDLLQTTIYNVSAKECGTQPRDFMLYYYYGGLVYIGLKDFEKALGFLSTCICTPSSCPSAIVVEAYKKTVLVSLILRGKAFVIPRHCPESVAKVVRMYAVEYNEYSEAFLQPAPARKQKVADVLERHQKTYQRDNNWGLVKQAERTYTAHSVKKLTLTYDTLALEGVARSVGLASAAEAEQLLVRMICSGQISARIDGERQMVHFVDPPMNDYTALMSNDVAGLQALLKRVERTRQQINSAEAATQEEMRTSEGRPKSVKSLMGGIFSSFKD